MESVKENAGGQAGVDVFGLQTDQTAVSALGKSTPNSRLLRSRSTETEVQRNKVLALLRNGAKTTIDLRAHGIMMPATRIFELKKVGHDIQTELVPLFDEHGYKHANCARYMLIAERAGDDL